MPEHSALMFIKPMDNICGTFKKKNLKNIYPNHIFSSKVI